MGIVAIIDYGMCNLDSVARAVEKCGGKAVVTDEASVVSQADGIILPGVGAFVDAMQELQSRALVNVLRQRVLVDCTPFLGICLGMQLMASVGTEGGETEGLGLIPGRVVRFSPGSTEFRIPHVGWNEVGQLQESVLFENVQDKTDFYFVHSYHFTCEEQFVFGRTPYCGNFTSMVGRGNCFGTQFHPEKSLGDGATIISNFLSLC